MASREKIPIGLTKKNSYVIKSSKDKVPIGQSGFKSAKIQTDEEKLDVKKNEEFWKKYPYSPFLMNPINIDQKESAVAVEKDKDAATFLSLEHYMYPTGQNEDPILEYLQKANQKLNKKSNIDDTNENKMWGYSRYYNILIKDYQWKRCEQDEYNEQDEYLGLIFMNLDSLIDIIVKSAI